MAGTPEKPLSDLGRVSYHAYWRSVILEYLDSHRNADITMDQISKDTGLHVEDIGISLEEMKIVREVGGTATLVVDWGAVDAHAARVRASASRIPVVPEALRWTPLVTQHVNPYQPPQEEAEVERSEEEDEEEERVEEMEEIREIPKSRSKRQASTPALAASSTSLPARGAKKPKAKETVVHQKSKRTPMETPRGRKSQVKQQNVKEEIAKPPEMLPRKRGRASAPAAADGSKPAAAPKSEQTLPKRRRTELVRPGRLSTSGAHTTTSESADDDSPPLITRTGRVSSLKIKRLLHDKASKKDNEAKTGHVNKMSIAAKLRWVERKKKLLLIQAGGENADITPQVEQKRKPGRPPRQKSEAETPPKGKASLKVTEPKNKQIQAESKVESTKAEEKKEAVAGVEKRKPVVIKRKPKKPVMQLKRFGQKKKRGWVKGNRRGPRKAAAAAASLEKDVPISKEEVVSVAAVIKEPTPEKKVNDEENNGNESVIKVSDETEKEDIVEDSSKEEDTNLDDSKMEVDYSVLKPEETKLPKEPEMVDIAATVDEETRDGDEEEFKKGEEDGNDRKKSEDILEGDRKVDYTEQGRHTEDKVEDKEGKKETREPIKMERRVLSDDSDDSRPPRSDHSRSPSPRHSSDDDLDLDKKSPLSVPTENVDTTINHAEAGGEHKSEMESPPQSEVLSKQLKPAVQEVLKPEPPIPQDCEDANRAKVEERRLIKEEKREERPLEKRDFSKGESHSGDVDQRATVDLTQDDDSPPEPPSRQQELKERSCDILKKTELAKEPEEEKPREELPSVHSGGDRLAGPFPQIDTIAHQKKAVAALERVASDRVATERAATERAAMHAAERAMAAANAQILKQVQERNPQVSCYTDCAQQAAAAAHHQHHMASQHMAHYHHQQAAVAMQQVAAAAAASKSSSGSSSRTKSSSSSSQRHQVGSPQPNYQAQSAAAAAAGYSAYMIHRVPPSASPAAQPPPRPVPCSNYYLQQSGQQPGSLAKLQQLTNGLETLSPHQIAGSTPPPPGSHGTPPPPGSYHKFYQGPSASAATATAAGRHAQQLLPQYAPAAFNGYRGAPQQPTATPPYLAAAAAANSNFINSPQMQMMNVQPQYSQDQGSAAAAANPMYTYGYLNGTLMQPLNSTMRR